jgi:putative oxidoreductase
MKSKVLFVLCLLTGLLFINAGLNKFLNYMPMPKEMPEKAVKAGMAFMTIGWILPLVGFTEIIGGLLLIFKKTRTLGAIVILPVLTGIVLANINTAPSALPMTAAIVAIIIWVIVENWRKYLPLISE